MVTATEVSTTKPAMVKWSRVKGKKQMTKELKKRPQIMRVGCIKKTNHTTIGNKAYN